MINIVDGCINISLMDAAAAAAMFSSASASALAMAGGAMLSAPYAMATAREEIIR